MKLWARCTCLYLRRSEGCPLTRGTGDAPPISFSVAPKRKRAVHGHLRAKSRRCASVALRNTSLRLGEKKRRFAAKRHGVPYLLMIRGSQQETLGGRIGVSVGRGPGLAEFFSHAPATKCSRASGLQDRFDLLLPAAAALPISQRLVSIFYPGSAERSGERGKRRTVHSTTTPKEAPTPPNAGKHSHCSHRPERTR